MEPDILTFSNTFSDFHLYYQYIFGCLVLRLYFKMKPDITLILPIKNEEKILFKNINKYKKKIESITKKLLSLLF